MPLSNIARTEPFQCIRPQANHDNQSRWWYTPLSWIMGGFKPNARAAVKAENGDQFRTADGCLVVQVAGCCVVTFVKAPESGEEIGTWGESPETYLKLHMSELGGGGACTMQRSCPHFHMPHVPFHMRAIAAPYSWGGGSRGSTGCTTCGVGVGGRGVAVKRLVSVPVGTSGCTHWFEFSEMNCLHCLSQACVEEYFW